MSGDNADFVAALDIGTTTIRCHIVDRQGNTVGKAAAKVKLLYPEPDAVEINADELWQIVLDVAQKAVNDANITFSQVISLGISTQRSTFTTWRKDNGKLLHNFVTWKDLRVAKMIEEVNKSWKLKGLRCLTYLLYLLTRIKKFGVVSKFRFSSNHVTIRLLYMLTHNESVKEALDNDNLLFGTMETWLVYKLTAGKTYVTDISNASATGMFDPFICHWSLIPKIVNIPEKIFPCIVENDFNFGDVDQEIFGCPIKIGCVMADQSSSMFGSCSFKENDLKLTLGTGGFLDINTGNGIQSSLNGMYPLVGWKIQNKLSYVCEAPCHDCGSLVEWMLDSELISDLKELNDLSSLQDNGGLYFISAFSGLGPPINNETCGSGFIGITPKTKKINLARAVLESIVYKIVLTYQMLKEERSFSSNTIVVDGGVSNNDLICQLLADLTNLEVRRFSDEIAIFGVAFLAGLSCGFWTSTEDLKHLPKKEAVFKPSTCTEHIERLKYNLKEWKRASDRFLSWRTL